MTGAAIAATGLTKRYGRSRGVCGITLNVERGERFGFLGPNGAGKTTFIRLVLGLLRPQAGGLTVMGHDVATRRMDALAQVGYLPGELALYGSLSGTRILDVLARLHPRAPVLRGELCEVLGLGAADLRRPTREYSRGMKQKLGLVSALQHDPPLAVLDEPTGGLDPVVQLRLVDWLNHRVERGMTVFFSSHVLAEVQALCDRVAMVRDGELVMTREVAGLDLSGVRTVRVRFAAPTDPATYHVAGVGPPDVDPSGRQHRFPFSGEPGALLARLGAMDVEDITITAATLEETVRTLYADAPGTAAG